MQNQQISHLYLLQLYVLKLYNPSPHFVQLSQTCIKIYSHFSLVLILSKFKSQILKHKIINMTRFLCPCVVRQCLFPLKALDRTSQSEGGTELWLVVPFCLQDEKILITTCDKLDWQRRHDTEEICKYLQSIGTHNTM